MKGPRIELIRGRTPEDSFAVTEAGLSIGRDESSDIYLRDDRVSRHHCAIRMENGLPLLIDLESSNGTYINGFWFSTKILVHGDIIRIGSWRMVYLDGDVDEELAVLIKRDDTVFTMPTERSLAYRAAIDVILNAFLDIQASINTIRRADEIQARIFDLIFKVVPAERAAILMAGHDQNRFVSASYRRIGSQSEDPFAIDEEMVQEVLCTGKAKQDLYETSDLCYPMTAFDTKVGVIYVVLAVHGPRANYHGDMGLLRSITGFAAVALEHARYVEWLKGENNRLNEVIHTDHGMIGRSEKMQEVYAFIETAGPADRAVLIIGASGTGKELVARAVHGSSLRSGKAFVAVNCGAFTETLLESELFGHEKGSFTGAVSPRKGLFEVADGGTIFLDEIGTFPVTMQPKLLRVLQEGEIRHVGGNRTIHVSVRVIAATNRNLKEAIQDGSFREDLYFRLNVLELEMPRLCERIDDIPLLVAHFIKKHASIRTNARRSPVLGVTPEVHHLLATYDWPGNVRELEHAIERAISMGASELICAKDLPKCIRGEESSAEIETYDAEFEAFQKALFERTLHKTAGNKAEAAELLGMNLKYFYQRCKDLGVKGP